MLIVQFLGFIFSSWLSLHSQQHGLHWTIVRTTCFTQLWQTHQTQPIWGTFPKMSNRYSSKPSSSSVTRKTFTAKMCLRRCEYQMWCWVLHLISEQKKRHSINTKEIWVQHYGLPVMITGQHRFIDQRAILKWDINNGGNRVSGVWEFFAFLPDTSTRLKLF